MAGSIMSKLRHAWDAFNNRDELLNNPGSIEIGPGYGDRPDRRRTITGGERTIISSIYTRIAIDVSSTRFEHVRMKDDRYLETLKTGLNNCLSVEANCDQTGTALIFDAVMSMLDEGVVAIVPVDTTDNPLKTGSYDILSLRTAKIIGWHPRFIDVEIYNDKDGQKYQKTLPKSMVAIIENPFYAVMNEPNSTLKRLVYKLGMLDDADAKANSSKLDLIIQLPYTVKSEMQMQRAEKRKKDIEMQLTGSKYGIAYLDATEKVTQLNRPIENNLLEQIKNLTSMLYSQLGLDETVLNGTATSETMNNYYNRTVAAFITAIKEELTRKFLTKTARSQGQTVMAFQDPFRYLTVVQIAGLVDSLSRNEVLTGNEFRTALGFKPSDDPSADELRNKNLIDPNADYGGDGKPVQEEPPLDSAPISQLESYNTGAES